MKAEDRSDLLAQGKALLENATKGPWRVKFFRPNTVEVAAEDSPPIIAWPGFDNCDVPVKRHKANAEAIVFWRNHGETLIASQEQLEATVQAQAQQLRELVEQWRDNVAAIGPHLEGAAFEQCANQVEAVLASARSPEPREEG